MKQIFTVSLEEETVRRLRDYNRKRSLNNKSYLVETAILKFLEAEDGA
jgi:predicted transcriptional regulator